MKDYQILTIGGVSLDKDARSLLPNEMSHALDSDLLGNESGQQSSVFPLPSSLEMYSIPSTAIQYQYVRAKFLGTADTYIFYIKDLEGNALGSATIAVNPVWTVADFVIAIDTALSGFGLSATYGTADTEWFSLAIYSNTSGPIGYVLEQYEIIDYVGSWLTIYTLQDYFTAVSAFKPLQGHQIGDNLFTFSKTVNGQGYEIGYASVDDNGTWTYTTLVQSRNFNFSENKVIEISSEEVGNGQYGIYWTDFNGKPKVLYTPTDMSSPLKYTMTSYETESSGMFTLESISEQTNLQIQNYARINFEEQLESGGSLDSGTWFYYVASGIGRNYSEWSPSSEPITVFSTNTSSPSAGSLVKGDKTPTITSKVNRLDITGIDARIYDSVKVAAVLNQGGVYSAFLIGEFETSQGGFQINHTGKETSIEIYDRNLLPPVSNLIVTTENLQVKKNRMNLSNIEQQIDTDLSDIFSTATLGQVKAELDSVGFVEFSSDNIVRVGLNTTYTLSTQGESSIMLDNDSTNGNFDTGSAYDLTTKIFTVPSTSDYNIGYEISLSKNIPLNLMVYALNLVNGERYALSTSPSRHGGLPPTTYDAVYFNKSQLVRLTGGHTIVLKISVNGPSGNVVFNANRTTFTVSENVSDYPIKKIKVGEYQLPQNIATKLGYMVNERYSYFARVEYNSGFKGKWHPLGRYTFVNGNMFPAAIEDGWLTDATATITTKVYSYGLTINGLDISSIKNDIKRIEIGRAICSPTILGTGIFIASNGSTGGAGGTFNSGLYTGNTNGLTYGDVFNSTNNNRYNGVMLCPDWATGDIKPQFQEGDKIIVYGCPNIYASQTIAGGNSKWGSYKEFFGSYFPASGVATTIDIYDAVYCEWNESSRTLRNDLRSIFLGASLSNDGTKPTLASEGMAMTLGVRINPNSGSLTPPDNGCYYVQYYRPNANQYNNIDDTIVSTNTFIDITPSTNPTLPEIQVFGGDTYTQKTYMKVLYNAVNPDTSKGGTLSSFIGFYSQNKINQQMRFTDNTFNNLPFPFGNSLGNYMFGTYEAGEQFQIDRGYTWENPTDYGRAYNPNIPEQSTFKARIIYSQQKVLNALEDAYRRFLPQDYKDLAAKDGAIHGLLDVNDVMIAIQENRVSVLPYLSDVMVSGTEVYLGNGGVYAQRENPVSAYGATLKSGIMLARNEAGNVNVYWWSKSGKGLMRYGADGVKNLSNENGYRTWFLNKYDLCNSEFDIVLGFDQGRNDIFLTARASNDTIATWNPATAYISGQKVVYGATNKYQTFEQLPDVYIALGNSTNVNPYDTPASWSYQPITDTDYYNYSTIIFNEKYNFFRGNFSLLVSRYFNYYGSIIIPRGIPSFNKVYNLFGGASILRWLEESDYKQGSFEVEWSVNKNGVIPKRYLSYGLVVGTDHVEANNPTTLLTTATQTSDSNGSEFVFQNGQLSEGVYSDENDNPMISEFMKIRFIGTSYFRIYAVACQFYVRARTLLK